MMRLPVALLVLFAFWASASFAQTLLLSENFDQCILPAGWQVKSIGNQNPVWYVGDAVLNNDNNGQSMNGSCFLFIDDDATGDQTPSYVLDFISPPFDASQHPVVELSVDVHYRDWAQANESFDVLVTDGTSESLIGRYDKFHATGNNLYEFETLVFDLTLLTQSANARIIFRYNDAGGFNWWAGVDNLTVTGKGQGTNILAESFNDCSKPNGWETQIVAGVDDWKFGVITEGAALSNGTSMNGSCFAFFDDDILGQDTPFSVVRLATPWFDGSQFAQFNLEFDLILRYHKEKIGVYVQFGNGEEHLVEESSGAVGGPYFPNDVHINLDLSSYRSQQMRVVFQYDDGRAWGWWVGIDNVKITGLGSAYDVCANAYPMLSGQTCIPANTANALLDGPTPDCVVKSAGGLWLKWLADFNGTALITTDADYNDVVNVFTGDCANLQAISCQNRDEHGFTSENTYFQASEGTQYFIRVSGQEGGFGIPRGNFCIAVHSVANPPVAPVNDDCANALPIEVDGPCLSGSNLNATSTPIQPRLNELARHDVWYQFTAPALASNEVLEIQSNADFSDIITAYSGSCDSLAEFASNHKGNTLQLTGLAEGTVYWVQISGTFATIEGSLCPRVLKKNLDAPANDQCANAIPVNIGGACVEGSNVGASYSGQRPPCVVSVSGDVWYAFTAPASGSIRLNSGADFPHVLAVWEGDCGTFQNLLCAETPLRCAGFLTLGALTPGATYYLQIASQMASAGPVTGQFCLQILDGAIPAPFEALQLQVVEKCVTTNVSELQVEAAGGIAPYTFGGTPNGQTLNSGETYLVIVTDAIGCETALAGVADDCEAQVCDIAGTTMAIHPDCFEGNNGHISVMVTGGTAPYTYLWSNGATMADINNLSAGTYSVTVTDALDCTVELNATLNDPLPILAEPSSINQPHQGQSDGAIFVDIFGGSGLYTTAWLLNGTAFAVTEDLTNAPAGDYTLIVTDGSGCTASFDFTLTETVGNQEVSTAFFTEVFPNPAHEKAWLAVAFPQPKTLHLSLVDATGRVLSAWTLRNVTEQNIPLDLKRLPAGTYQLRIRTEKDLVVEQVVVGR